MQIKWTPELPKKRESVKSDIFEADKRTFQLIITNQEENVYMSIEYFGNSYADIITHTKIAINSIEKDYPYSFNRYNNVFTFVIPSMKFYKISVVLKVFPNPYKSKFHTGFSGMRNLGATCYMNSYLQLLYHISAFTLQLYKQEPNKKTFQLQKLFYKLINDEDVDTRSFVNNCQWFSDVFTHQDVHEFGKLVFDAIEEENKKKTKTEEGKEEENTEKFFIDDLFQGLVSNYVIGECGCESSVKDKFYEFQLEIRDWMNNVIADNIQDGLRGLKNVEKLEGDNKYRCEKHGLVNAIKGSSISHLPPVLTVLLKRFSIDYNTGESKKINDRYTFSEFIDVTCEKHTGQNAESEKTNLEDIKKVFEGSAPLLEDSIHKDAKNKRYKLFGVVVHSGAVADGHYYCYLNIDGWFKFNDTIVTRVSEDEAIFDNFGGFHPYKLNEKIYSAYLLIYVDLEQWANIIGRKIEIDAFVKEKILESESGRIITLNLITKNEILGYKGSGLFEKSLNGFMEINQESISARSDDTLYVLFKNSSKRHSYVYDALTLQPLSNDECVVENKSYFLHSELKKRKNSDILLFLKRYRYEERCIQEVDYGFELHECCFFDQNMNEVGDIIERMGLSDDYIFFIEEKIENNDFSIPVSDDFPGEYFSSNPKTKNIIDHEINKLINKEHNANKRFRNSECQKFTYELKPFNPDITLHENGIVNGSILIACKQSEEGSCRKEYSELINRQYICLKTPVGEIDLYLSVDLTYSTLIEYLRIYFLSDKISIFPFDGTIRENGLKKVKVELLDGAKMIQFADGTSDNNLNNLYHHHSICLDQLTVRFIYQKISMLKCVTDVIRPEIDRPLDNINQIIETNNKFNKIIYDKLKESYHLIEVYENSPYYDDYCIDDTISGTGRLILRKKSPDRIISLIYYNNNEFVGYPILISIKDIKTVKDLRIRYSIATQLGKYNGNSIVDLNDNDRMDNFTEVDIITNHGLE